MQNVADLIDPTDLNGRTYREINNSTPHTFSCGDLVGISTGARLFVTRLSRDCDGTPLYCLGVNTGHTVLAGYCADDMELIKT